MNALSSSTEIAPVERNKIVLHPGSLGRQGSLLRIIAKSNKLIVQSTNGFTCYPFSEIQFLKAQSNYTELHTGQKKVLISKTLKSLEAQLPEQLFFRVHKSFLVNAAFIKSYVNTGGESCLTLDDGTCIPVSRANKGMFR